MSESRKESLAEGVYRELREAIIVGDLKPGTVLYEGDLTARFTVSTSPVREALTHLRHDGLIKVIPRKGYLVTDVSLQDLQELLQLRVILEGASAELAAPNVTEAHLAQLTELAEVELIVGDSGSYRTFKKANQEFHEEIAQISGNSRLARLVGQVLAESQRILFAGLEKSNPGALNQEHYNVIEALATHDPRTARRAVVQHIEVSRQRLVERLLQSSGERELTPLTEG